MSRVYKNHCRLYSCLQEFQEKAVRFLNEIYGRQKKLDFFDFAVDKENDMYIAVGYYNGEKAPGEQQPGEAVSEEAKEAIEAPAGEPAPVAQPAPEQDKAKRNVKKRK